jgi:hypothetical protein
MIWMKKRPDRSRAFFDIANSFSPRVSGLPEVLRLPGRALQYQLAAEFGVW